MSNEIVSTPRGFLDVVEARFGSIKWDLAANGDNDVTHAGRYLGPGSIWSENTLTYDWTKPEGLCWLNPPFSRHTMPTFLGMLEKCAQNFEQMNGILLLVPAAVCTNWFREFVAPSAYVFELSPRVFKKEVRDVILAYYHPARLVGREPWRWRP